VPSVILESRIRRGKTEYLWVATEVGYTPASDGVNLDRPVVLSGGQRVDRKRLEAVFWALLDARGSYFRQVMAAVKDQGKESVS